MDPTRRTLLAAPAALAALAAAPAPEAAAETASATLWGVYGEHSMHDCPLFNVETAKLVVAASEADLGPIMAKYGVVAIHDQYHSGLEHTLLWVIETERPHELEEFLTELGVAAWNTFRIVPLRTFAGDVVPEVRRLHGL